MNLNIDTALEIAKEITVSMVSHAPIAPDDQGGADVADFFESVFKKFLGS